MLRDRRTSVWAGLMLIGPVGGLFRTARRE